MPEARAGSPAATCNLCGGRDIALYHDQGWRKVVRCRGCGLVFVDPMPTPEEKAEIERLAYEGEILPETADFFRDVGRDFKSDPAIEAFREGLREIGRRTNPGRLLDVGPGFGIFLHLAKNEFGWEPHGVDICRESTVKAKEEFDIDLEVGDFDTYPWPEASFDAVTMLDMLEHTIDPTFSLRRAYSLLRPGGVLYVVVPNQHSLLTRLIDFWVKIGGPMRDFFLERLYVSPHSYYFTPATLRRLLEKTGFAIDDQTTGDVYLGRYRLPLWQRVPMEIVLRAGTVVGMGAKISAVARRPGNA